MLNEIIATYAIKDHLLKAIRHQDDVLYHSITNHTLINPYSLAPIIKLSDIL